jgi:hypothetical protein
VRLLDEVREHLLGDFEVGDDAVLHRLDGDDVAGRPAEHLLGFLADGFDAAVTLLIATMDGSLTTMPLPRAYTQVFGSSKVHGEIAGKSEKSDRSVNATPVPQRERGHRPCRCPRRGYRSCRLLDAVHGSVGSLQ